MEFPPKLTKHHQNKMEDLWTDFSEDPFEDFLQDLENQAGVVGGNGSAHEEVS
jgi:hypothetical protein